MAHSWIVNVIFPAVLILAAGNSLAENIDPYNNNSQYVWSENIGWLNFEPSAGSGVQVWGTKLTGWVWAENIGWISLSCENTGSCGSVKFGVKNDSAGRLTGFAWGENVGWINFSPIFTGDPVRYGVTIDSQGRFSGFAWGENIGWIKFDAAQIHNVQVCIVTFEDLVRFVSYWMQSGAVPAELDGVNGVGINDFAVFAANYLDYCPDGWQLTYSN